MALRCTTVESYDPRTGAWETGPPLPIPLHHAAAATYRGEVVVLGGTSDNIADGVEQGVRATWRQLGGVTEPHARSGGTGSSGGW